MRLEPLVAQKLETVFSEEPFGYLSMAQAMAPMKKDYLQIGVNVPPILLHGDYGTGKTSCTQALMKKETNLVRFSDSFRELKKKLKEYAPEETVLVDNYPQYLSSAGKQQGKRILEYLVDHGFDDPDFPTPIITAEQNIYADIEGKSIQSKLLEVEMPNLEKELELCELRDFVKHHRKEYLYLLTGFERWYERNRDPKDMEEEWARFRHGKKQSFRTLGMVFAYYYASLEFFRYLQGYGLYLDEKKIEENCKQLLDWKETKVRKKEVLSVVLLRRLLEREGAFAVTEPKPAYYCRKYLEGSVCEQELEEGYNGCSKSCGEKQFLAYDPLDLRLGTEENAAVLVKNPRQIYQYPSYLPYGGAILIVRGDDLLRMIHTELGSYCYEQDKCLPAYGSKRFHKELFQNNLCLYHYWKEEHKTYVFSYHNKLDEKESVLLLKLTKEQYQKLHTQANEPLYKGRRMVGEHKKICSAWKEIGKHVQSMVGKDGIQEED